MYGADILLIEDNPHDAELILSTLREKDRGVRVRTIDDGAEALDYFFGPRGCLQDDEACLPKLILLDLKLPRVGGLEILRSLKKDERTRRIPTVVFSSSDEAQDRINCYNCGVNSYIVKPVDADRFSSVVEDISNYWILKNRVGYSEA
jgi:CheY-like chemotaxis protein